MHLTPSDPDIATLYRKIRSDRLDLQPNFQRGEVWGKGKKQRLIDSILRGWHIPPIHVIQVPGSDRQEVLDGQQRLAAIRDFIEGEFPIYGEQEPFESNIARLDGMYWAELPLDIRARLEDFTIRILTISDYKPREPGELFYRLNQPTNLTSAEQRNAYFGEARQQVKNLTEFMEVAGASREMVGFSNSRMAYDDVIAKFLLTLEFGTLYKKVTANTVTSRYRESTGFNSMLTNAAEDCIALFLECLAERGKSSKLNKATVSSWLLFIHGALGVEIERSAVQEFFDRFESIRENLEFLDNPDWLPPGVTSRFVVYSMQIYQDRASSRVADTTSVVLRDMIMWGMFSLLRPEFRAVKKELAHLNSILHYYSSRMDTYSETVLLKSSKDLNWGAEL